MMALRRCSVASGDDRPHTRETSCSSLLTCRGKKHSLTTILSKHTPLGLTSRVASTSLTRSWRKGHEIRLIHDAIPPT